MLKKSNYTVSEHFYSKKKLLKPEKAINLNEIISKKNSIFVELDKQTKKLSTPLYINKILKSEHKDSFRREELLTAKNLRSIDNSEENNILRNSLKHIRLNYTILQKAQIKVNLL